MGWGFLTIDYCLQTIGYCFLEVFVGDKALMEGDKVTMGVPPTRENPPMTNEAETRRSV